MLLQKACVSNALKILPFLPILILSKLNSFKWVSSTGFFRLFTCVRRHSVMMSVVTWKKYFLPHDWKFSFECSFILYNENCGQANEHTVKSLMLNENCQHTQYPIVLH